MTATVSDYVSLNELCAQDRRIASTDDMYPVLGLDQIAEATGEIADQQGAKAATGEGTYFAFSDHHVLYCKLRPYLNKVAVPHSPGRCSTELVPLKPANGVDRRYLAYLLRSGTVLNAAIASASGARMPRTDMDVFLRHKVRRHSTEEQRQIVDILDRAASIQRLRKAADDKVRELVPALFVDMFGDPTTNPMGFEMVSLGSICNLVRGSSPRPQGDKRYFGGSVPRLMIADITRDGVYVTPKIDSLTELGATKSRPMKRGEVVMAVSGAVGLPAILNVDACIHDGFVGFRALSKSVLTEYLYWFIRSQRQLASSQAVGATFQNLTTDQIRQWSLPVPKVELQQEFAARANSVASQARRASHSLLVLQDTVTSLSRVFFGP